MGLKLCFGRLLGHIDFYGSSGETMGLMSFQIGTADRTS